MFSKFQTVDLGAIKPQGWVKDFLLTQANGITDKLAHTGYPYSIAFWQDGEKGDETPPWEVFEQNAYWIDGSYCCGVLIGKENLISRADENLKYSLSHIAQDGFIGPDVLRESDGWHRWPQVVYFRAMIAKYEYTHDDSIVQALSDFYLKGNYDYSTKREFLHIEIMLWVYGKTSDKRLLELAEKTYSDYNKNCKDDNREEVMLSDAVPYAHGVTYDETCKIGAILYMYTGKERYLHASIHAFEKLDKWFMLSDGGHCSNEFLLGNDSLQSHETCTITDYTWALYYLLMATGDVKYADKIEKCIFNAGIGAVKEDFSAIQYFSCPNQVLATQNSNHNAFFCGEQWMGYNSKHNTDCCVGNVNRFMPNFVRRLWMRKEKEIIATLYSPNSFNFLVDGVSVRIEEKTNYPFEDTIAFSFNTEQPVAFTLSLRIPKWSNGATVTVNGKEEHTEKNGEFYSINHTFDNRDEILLKLYPKIEAVTSADDGIYLTRGPLVFALGLPYKEERVKAEGGDGTLCNYNLTATDAWNYALDAEECLQELKFERLAVVDNLWTLSRAPLRITLSAHKVEKWQLFRTKKVKQVYDLYKKLSRDKDGDFVFTPSLPQNLKKNDVGEKELITLVPVGAAKLRITVFPKIHKD